MKIILLLFISIVSLDCYCQFSPYSTPVTPGSGYRPINDDMLLQGAQQRQRDARQRAEFIAQKRDYIVSLYHNLINCNHLNQATAIGKELDIINNVASKMDFSDNTEYAQLYDYTTNVTNEAIGYVNTCE